MLRDMIDFMANSRISSRGGYLENGVALMFGFEPHQGGYGNLIGPMEQGAARGHVYAGYNAKIGDGRLLGQLHKSGFDKWANIGGSLFTAGFSIWNVYTGFREDGIRGAYDAAVWDLAASSAAARFAYGTAGTGGPVSTWTQRLSRTMGTNAGIKLAGSPITSGGLSRIGGMPSVMGMARMGGAGIGAWAGQSILGTPGAFLGAFIGAAPVRFAATHPLIAGGMVAGAATAAVGYGAYAAGSTLLKAGYQHRQRQRGIDTSGSMAAFMTGGAQTMRQRAVQAIHKSHLNARSALGQEAGFMHMPAKNYHSRYR